MVRIAAMRVDHYIGTHFIQRQNNFISGYLAIQRIADGLTDEIPDFPQVPEAATNLVTMPHGL